MPSDTAAPAPLQGAPRNDLRFDLWELLRLAFPIVGARLGIMVMGLTDAIVVGRYSSEQLAFHALGWAPTSVVLTTAVGLLVGVQVMAARLIGQDREAEVGAVLRRGLVYSFWIGIAFMVLLIAGGPWFLHSIGIEKSLADGAGHVLLIFSLSLPTYLVSVAATYWLEALGKPGPGMIAMWLCNGVNLAFNLVLVPGALGFPAMGAAGAAWATFGSRLALVIMVLAYIALMPRARALGVFDKPKPDRATAAEQRKVGYGAGASYFVEAGAFAGMNIVTAWIGAAAVAAWAVVLNVSAVIFMVPLGLAGAAAVMVGRAYGRRDPADVMRQGWLAFGVALAFGIAVTAVVLPGSKMIAGVYTRDPGLIAVASSALLWACLFFAVDALQVVTAQVLRARADVLVPTVTHVISYAFVMAPLPGSWPSR